MRLEVTRLQQESREKSLYLNQRVIQQESARSQLPACFANARNQTLVGQLPKANAANTELAIYRPRTSAKFASVLATDGKLGAPLSFGDLAFTCHWMSIRS